MRSIRTGLTAVAIVVAGSVLRHDARGSNESSDAGERASLHFDRIRQDPARAADPAEIDALAREAPSLPPGLVRGEAQMRVAEAWLSATRVDEAIAELRLARDDPEADPLTARLAARAIVDALADQGRLDDARAEARAHANQLDPQFVRQTERLVRRRTMRLAAFATLGAFVSVACAGLARARFHGALGQAGHAVRGMTPVATGLASYVAFVGGALASQYETGRALPFLLFGLGVLPLVLLARAWAAVGSPRASARIGRAALCAASVLAMAFVLLEAINPAYLDGFGL